MRALIWGLLLAALAILASLFAQGQYGEHGNVVLMMPPWRVDVSLNFFLLLLAGGAFVLFVGAYLAVRVTDFPARVRAYQQRREEIGSQRALREAVRTLLEGRFSRAERAARAAQATPENAGVACLLGARAAHRMQEFARRDAWLDEAALEDDVKTARLVAAAEMWNESRENTRALDALARLRAGGTRHVHAARVALSASAHAGRWGEVLKGVRTLAKRNALHPALAAQMRLRAHRAQLAEWRYDGATLEAAWERIPADERAAPELALEAARLLTHAGRPQAAAAALEAALARAWDSRSHAALLDEYARAPALPVRARIERAETWLKEHPRDAALLRCLGLLCLREQLWGKARSYLTDSLREEQHPATLLALARLAETLGDEAEAARHYREAALGFARTAMAPSAEVSVPERRSESTL
jgi:HemY protein